ncbi:hypothetical protein K491DRAFT_149326 [Lophiostoma macrostomum CBS 122681]|uniref:Uncharacterized protein n=1 Tax=Lophiostoma macrostomum CBS 122681 TaxID=1314788 RepID=A0A6A6SR02_9PLEO|nr:hypothetical protein K491DRAFT_149326 [Lophiostoma macrostomum CBS 122681]
MNHSPITALPLPALHPSNDTQSLPDSPPPRPPTPPLPLPPFPCLSHAEPRQHQLTSTTAPNTTKYVHPTGSPVLPRDLIPETETSAT